jgi:hypothetical protein
MVRKMLSLHRGKPLAIGVDKKGKKLLTIYITDEEKDPDIVVDNPLDIIDDRDISQVAKLMRLVNIEIKMIRNFINSKQTDTDREKLNDRLSLAIEKLKEISTTKVKKKILFDRDDEVSRVVPLIGGGAVNFDRSIFLCGPSVSGKTFLSKEIIKHDEKIRPIVVFSKIDNDDSLKELKKMKLKSNPFTDEKGKDRMIKISLRTDQDLLNLPSNTELKNCICLFDDIDSFPKDMADFLNQYRDSILECGRHHNITVLSTSHQLYNWAKTRVILNESELVCMFPHSNKRNSMLFLRDRMGLNKQEVQRIMDEIMDHSRSIVCKMSAPNMIFHEKGVMLL